MQAIEGSIEKLLKESGIHPRAVDRVFLTGGSSFVPAVRSIFESRFGKDRIRCGNEFTSVAHGRVEDWCGVPKVQPSRFSPFPLGVPQ